MPNAAIITLVALAAAGCAVLATLLILRRRRFDVITAPVDGNLQPKAPLGMTGMVSEEWRPSPVPVVDSQVLVLPGTSDDEVYAFGARENLDVFGTTVIQTPMQLGSWATQAKAAVDGVQAYQQMVGCIVRVDPEMAGAIRAGRAAKDKAGEVLALVRNSKGRFEHVARLKGVGGLAAAASMTNALSAMALQAQLDRIEKQLTTISEQVGSVQRQQLREWNSEARAAQLQLAEVYRTARSAETLSEMNWRQIESSGILLRQHLLHDIDRLREAITTLEDVARDRTLRGRERRLTDSVEVLLASGAALEDSSRSWVQFSTLRLWRMTVVDDPTLESYREELAAYIARQATTLDPLIARADAAISQVADFRWWHLARNPIAGRRLPAKVEAALVAVRGVDWAPLRLEQPHRRLETPQRALDASAR
ncbi:hypothetical protein HRW23_34620 [Streptomyces lunaelactis]|nr:hypothetical protein [Streptomyces lunaelactis]NUK07837.1 hypothetical protein [Streptomyces lunaelactis]NUK24038.1 hypothetical protein [Streptomyces lunaelactis]NUK34148.1 hypothetical protein [Streptomyces lunaelactis]NUK40581.1 hypothetical protein [Streptomyces lunaelactis]NUK52302.1 hypothetical protein [Streptomyces lunaelactis]